NEVQLQTIKGWAFLASGFLIAAGALAFFFYFRARLSRRYSEELNQINESKSHFFANLSHEFRTPLTLMIGPAEKLIETATPEDKPWLELIHRNARRLLFLDEQLLEFTKLDSGVQKIQLVFGNILAHLQSISDTFQLHSLGKEITYSCSFPADPVEILFDADIVEKVVSNLLNNAFKYTPPKGSIDLKVVTAISSDQIKSNNSQVPSPEKYLGIYVSDNGIGIPESRMEQIFERFYQLNQNPGNAVEGVGIGLALTKELLKLHNGMVTVESTVGKGSVFSVFLPLDRNVYTIEQLKGVGEYLIPEATPSRQNETLFNAEPISSSPPDFPKALVSDSLPSVLVVDDNADMRLYLKEILKNHYAILQAENGEQGFEIAGETIPDLVITDIMMFPMDGIALCNQLKTDEKTSHIPVIMLTALGGVQERLKGLETGADDYLAKPFNANELLVRSENLIRSRLKLRQLFSTPANIELKDISVTSADDKFLEKLKAIIEGNIDNAEMDVDFLVKHIAMSRSQLHRKISALTGQPITGFIRIIRIKRAAQLFDQKFGNVSDVMYAVGFNNLSYFTKCFREVYQMTPSEYISR
ncbi:MAG: response regulator, partial [Bacteroidota bacterium]